MLCQALSKPSFAQSLFALRDFQIRVISRNTFQLVNTHLPEDAISFSYIFSPIDEPIWANLPAKLRGPLAKYDHSPLFLYPEVLLHVIIDQANQFRGSRRSERELGVALASSFRSLQIPSIKSLFLSDYKQGALSMEELQIFRGHRVFQKVTGMARRVTSRFHTSSN